jgi:ribosomal protein S10
VAFVVNSEPQTEESLSVRVYARLITLAEADPVEVAEIIQAELPGWVK